MPLEHRLSIWSANELTSNAPDRKSRSATICKRLDELSREGWRVIGQSVLGDTETMDYALDSTVTNFTILFTLVREVS